MPRREIPLIEWYIFTFFSSWLEKWWGRSRSLMIWDRLGNVCVWVRVCVCKCAFDPCGTSVMGVNLMRVSIVDVVWASFPVYGRGISSLFVRSDRRTRRSLYVCVRTSDWAQRKRERTKKHFFFTIRGRVSTRNIALYISYHVQVIGITHLYWTPNFWMPHSISSISLLLCQMISVT